LIIEQRLDFVGMNDANDTTPSLSDEVVGVHDSTGLCQALGHIGLSVRVEGNPPQLALRAVVAAGLIFARARGASSAEVGVRGAGYAAVSEDLALKDNTGTCR
jgi:hypothetical protein